jgi:excisionase family DNA binding protein
MKTLARPKRTFNQDTEASRPQEVPPDKPRSPWMTHPAPPLMVPQTFGALLVHEAEPLLIGCFVKALEAQRPTSDWTDQEGIAEHLYVSPPTARKMADEGRIPFVYVGAHRRFSRSAVDKALIEEAAKRNQDGAK